MNKETAKRIRLVYGILVGIMVLITGICLIAACIGIYRSGGDQIYTAEKVAQAFQGIATPVYLSLVLILLGFLLDPLLPCTDKKRKAEKNPAAILERLMSKRDLDSCDMQTKAHILRERKQRRIESVIVIAVLLVCSIGFLFYGANSANFHQTEINASMAKAVIILLCWLAVPFGLFICVHYRSSASLQREIDLVKMIPAGEKKPAPVKAASSKGLLAVRLVLVCVGIALLVYGFFAGGTADVLTKAINICTECVGLG